MERYDSLIADSMIETDLDVRFEMFHEAEDILMEEGYYIPLYSDGGAWLISDNVKNVDLRFNGSQIDISKAYKER